MDEKVLITAGMHAFAQRVAKTLPLSSKIIFGAAESIPQLLINSGKYIDIPNYKNPTFNHELLKLAISEDIQVIIPLKKEEIMQLAESKELFEEYGIKVAVPSLEALKTIDFFFNPGKEFIPKVVIKGRLLGEQQETISATDESGVCLFSDTGEEVLFCCLT